MLTVLKILLALAVIALMLLLVCLFMPLKYELSLTGFRSRIEFRVICPGLRLEISSPGEDAVYTSRLLIFNHRFPGRPNIKSKTSSTGIPADAQSKKHSFSLRKLILDKGLRQQGLQCLSDAWRIIKPRHLSVNARIGFSEPHYTGWMMAVAALLQTDNPTYTIYIDGNWVEPGLEGEINAAGKFMPVMILWPALKFLTSAEVRAYYPKGLRRSAAHAQAA